VLKAKDAFGNPNMQPLKKMKRSEFPKGAKLDVGEKLVAQGDDKSHMNVILQIAKVTGDDVDVRLVHPLAEKDINIQMIATSEIHVTCIIDRPRVRDAVRALHTAFELERI